MPGIYTVVVKDCMGCSKTFEFEVTNSDPIIIFLKSGTFEVECGVPYYSIVIDTFENNQTADDKDANGCMISGTFFY